MDQFEIDLFLNRTRYTSRIHLSRFFQCIGQSTHQHYIRDAEVATWFQYPVYFLKYSMFVRNQVQYTIAHHYISHIRCDRHVFNITLPEFNIVEAPCFSIFSGFLNHRAGKINADHFSSGTGFMACNKTIISCTAAKINHEITFLDSGKLCWQSASKSQICIGIVALKC